MRFTLSVLVLFGLFVLAIAGLQGHLGILDSNSAQASHGGPDEILLDMRALQTPANTATTLGSREACARINENNSLDADEDTTADSLTVDGTVTNIPASNPMIAFQYELRYEEDALTVQSVNVNFLLAANAGSTVLNTSDPTPDTNGSDNWTAGGLDTSSSAPETGSGVLARQVISSDAPAVPGLYTLGLGAPVVIDTTANAFFPHNADFDSDGDTVLDTVTNGGQVAVDQACAGAALADLSVDSVNTVDVPLAQQNTGSAFTATLSGVIANGGPSAADWTATFALTVPSDCAANPVGGPTQTGLALASGATAPVSKDFAVTCSNGSSHVIDGSIEVATSPPGATTDPDPSNNGPVDAPGNDSINIIATANLNVDTPAVDAPTSANNGSPFNVTVSADISNAGPATTDVDATLDLTIPVGCNRSPNNSQLQTLPGLANGASAGVTATWIVTCTTDGLKPFTGTIAAVPTTLHVQDPTPASDSATDNTDVTTPVVNADMKATAATVSAPASGNGGVAFNVTASGTIHNNGPAVADADLSWSLNLPSDCTTSTANPQENTVSSAAVSVNTPVSAPAAFSVTCTQPSFHTFTVTLTVAAVGATDPNPGNNSIESAQDTTPVTVGADPSVTLVTVNAPTTASSGVAFNVDVVTDLANSGFAPVNVDVSTTLTLGAGAITAGCTATPPSPQTQPNVALVATGQVTETFSVTCSGTGAADFTGSATVTLDTEHVNDTNPGNNTGQGTDSTTIEAVALSADMKAEAATADAPANASAGVAFDVTASGTIHNNGLDVADADLEWTLNLPPDCTTTTTNPQTSALSGVSVSVDTPASPPGAFSVTCTGQSFHDFSVMLEVAANGATDPTPGNNSVTSANDTTAVSAEADPSVVDVVVNAPASATPNTPFNVDVVVDLANNFGVSPVNVDVDIDLILNAGAVAAGCAETPNTPQDENDFSLGATTQITKTWSVTCTTEGTADFSGSGVVTIDQLHVVDAVAENNSDLGAASTIIDAGAVTTDLKVTSVTVSAPDTAAAGTAFDVSVTASVHNNGPETPIDASVSITLSLPPDCTSTPTGAQTVTAPDLAISVNTPLAPVTFSVTCTDPSTHIFSGSATATITTPDVTDSNPANNSGAGADNTAVTSTADLSASANVVAPATAFTGTAFDVSVEATVNNAGPEDTLADVIGDLLVPADCTRTPDNSQTQATLITNGGTAMITFTWSVTCTAIGNHTFTGGVVATPTTMHVSDPTPAIATDSADTDVQEPAVTGDLKMVSAAVDSPTAASVGVAFDVTASGVVHNNGPDILDADVSFTLNLPADCTTSTANPQTTSLFGVAVSANANVAPAVPFSVTCTTPSFHDFSVSAAIAAVGGADPTPGNNSANSAPDTTPITGNADVKVNTVTLSVPPTADAGVDFTATITANIHNNGPIGPVDGSVSFTLALPAGCTSPDSSVTILFNALAVSTSVDVAASITVNCTEAGPKVFTGSVDAITVSTVHVEDNNVGNNTGTSAEQTTNIEAAAATADLKMVSAAVDSPAAASVGVAFDVTASGVVHNNGPDVLDADVSFTLNLPADCTTSTANPQTTSLFGVAVSANANVAPAVPFSVTCTTPSFHDFSVSAAIAAVGGADPTPGNNSANSAPDTTPITGNADVKVNTVTLSVPPTADAGVDFTATITANIHNNGPIGPVDGSVSFTLALPAGCTSPDSSVTILFNALAVSTSVDVAASITVNCTEAGPKVFTGSVDAITVSTVHVEDNNAGNNTGTSAEQTTNIEAEALADLKVTGVTVSAPAETAAGVPFAVTVSATVHNNGPTTPIDASVFVDLMVPDDCTTTPSGTDVPANGLAMSVPTVVATVTFEVTCSDPSSHTFEALVEGVVTTPDVTDSNTGNNTMTGTATTAVVASADPSVTLVTVNAPATAAAGEAFNVDVVVDLANSGFSPVNVDVDATLALGAGATAAGCTATPNTPQTEEDFELGATGQVTFSFSVMCTTAGTADFSATATVTLDQLHVVDANADNNSGTGTATTTIEEDEEDNDPGIIFGSGEIKNGDGRHKKEIESEGFLGFTEHFGFFGHWKVKFENVSVNSLDGKRFQSTEITSLQFSETGSGWHRARLGLFTADGKLNGVPGYSITVCIADRGHGFWFWNQQDSTRIQLYDPNGVLIYDSYASGDFPSQDNTGEGACANRHKVDHGNYHVIPFD